MRALIAADRDAFYASEIELRERRGYPPFGRLASLLVSAPTSARRRKALRAGSRPSRRAASDVRVLGPAEAPLALVRGRYRFRLLAKSPRAFDLSAYLREWLAAAPKRQGQRASSRSMSTRRASSERPGCATTAWRPCGMARAAHAWAQTSADDSSIIGEETHEADRIRHCRLSALLAARLRRRRRRRPGRRRRKASAARRNGAPATSAARPIT